MTQPARNKIDLQFCLRYVEPTAEHPDSSLWPELPTDIFPHALAAHAAALRFIRPHSAGGCNKKTGIYWVRDDVNPIMYRYMAFRVVGFDDNNTIYPVRMRGRVVSYPNTCGARP